MEESTKEMIDGRIKALVNQLKATNYGSEQYGKIVKDIQTLVNAYAELDRTENDKFDKDRRFAEEVRYKDQDLHYKDALEREKMNAQKSAGNRDAVIKIISMLFTTVPTVALAILGLKLEFVDHGSICTFGVKELLKRAGQNVKLV